jgi:hypothetical protein
VTGPRIGGIRLPRCFAERQNTTCLRAPELAHFLGPRELVILIAAAMSVRLYLKPAP